MPLLHRFDLSLDTELQFIASRSKPISCFGPRRSLTSKHLKAATHLLRAESPRALVRQQLHVLLDAGFRPMKVFDGDYRKYFYLAGCLAMIAGRCRWWSSRVRGWKGAVGVGCV